MKKRILYGNLFFLGLSSVVLLFVTFSFFIAIFNKSAEKELVAMGQELSTQVERTLSGLLSDHLRAVAEEAVQLATEQQRRYQAGLTSESAARQGLLDVLASRRIGRNGYVFVLTAKGFVELHPEQNLVGREIEQIEQFRKTQPLTDRLRTIHPGYIEYDWQPLQGAGNRPKALYLEHFRPWDWLIAVSCYRDEVLDLVKPEALNTMMRAFRYGRNGHAVLMDDQGRMLTHSPPTMTTTTPNWPKYWLSWSVGRTVRRCARSPSPGAVKVKLGSEHACFTPAPFPTSALSSALSPTKPILPADFFPARCWCPSPLSARVCLRF